MWHKLRKNPSAFTLVEIMIVIAIVGLLAAASIPAILRSRMNANHNVAKSNIRIIRDAVESYRIAQIPVPRYPPDLTTLSSATPAMLDSVLATASAPPGKQGYYFTYTGLSDEAFTLTAQPDSPGTTGEQTYFVDESGTVRYNNASGPPIE